MDPMMQSMMQPQQNPVAQWWKAALEAQVAQMNVMLEELGKLETKGAEQATAAIDEFARLSKAGLESASEMQAAWLRIAKQASKQGLS